MSIHPPTITIDAPAGLFLTGSIGPTFTMGGLRAVDSNESAWRWDPSLRGATASGLAEWGLWRSANIFLRFDALFLAMKARESDAERLRIIGEMTALLERERPWIELVHPEDYALYHGWLRNVKPAGMSYPTVKYRDLDALRRAELRAAWNEPVRWPAVALAALGVAIVVPGVRTFLRERQ